MAVYPSNIAPIGVKLWENAVQTLPDISFFEDQNKLLAIFLSKNWRRFCCQEPYVLEELGIFECHWQIPRRKSLPVVRLFVLHNPGRRVKSGTDRFCS